MNIDIAQGISREELKLPIGNYCIPVETAFHQETKVTDVLKALQGKHITHAVTYFYAHDTHKRLTGVLGTRDLLFSEPNTKIETIMHKKTISIPYSTPLEDALKMMNQHELLALPVVDENKSLCGIFELPSHDIFSQKDPTTMDGTKRSKYIFQLIGFTIEQAALHSSLKEYRYRMPWLLCNLLSGLICAFIAGFFPNLLSQFVVIAMFIPLVLTLGEAVAMQSMTLSLQFLHDRKMHWKRIVGRIWVETRTAILLGLTCATLLALVYCMWYQNYLPMIAIAVSIWLSMMVSTTFGSLLPLSLHILSLDPKVAAGPVVLMLTDIAITIIYLTLSTWILEAFPTL